MLAINEELHQRYLVIRRLGQGGMGAVYEASDIKRFGKPVALKEIIIDTIKTTSSHQQEILQRAFEREAKILTQLDHESFPQVIDYFSEAERQYLVMELVPGDDLERQLHKLQSPFPLDEVIDLATQLLEALSYLHTLNPPIIHRDIKPHNIKLTSRGKIKLLDFGIAKGSETQLTTTVANQTFIAATLNYSPLEQIIRVIDENYRFFIFEKYNYNAEKLMQHRVDPRSDIYSLGATLYHLITAQLPADSLKRAIDVWSHKPDPLSVPHQVNSQIPVEFSNWLLKAMAIDFSDRFLDVAEMRRSLFDWLESEKIKKEEEIRNEQLLKEKQWLEQQELLKLERLSVEAERQQVEAERRKVEEAWLNHLKTVEESKKQAQINLQSQADAQPTVNNFDKQSYNFEERNIQNDRTEILPANPLGQIAQTEKFNIPFSEVSPTEAAITKSAFSDSVAQKPIIKAEVKPQIYSVSDYEEAEEALSPYRKLLPIAAIAAVFFAVGGIIFWNVVSDSASGSAQSNPDSQVLAPPTGMVLVRGGELNMGRDSADPAAPDYPAHKVRVEKFFMDTYEITNEEYAQFLNKANRKPPANWKNSTFPKSQEKFPVTNVDWEDANLFCQSQGESLPTEEQWEFAAKGTTNALYPWGNEWIQGKANANGVINSFMPVGKYSGYSPFGVLDMVGNAWEWTSSDFAPYQNSNFKITPVPKTKLKTIRGGAYDSNKDIATVTNRMGLEPTGADKYAKVGFRCIKQIQ